MHNQFKLPKIMKEEETLFFKFLFKTDAEFLERQGTRPIIINSQQLKVPVK